jgi:hypothetical protein
MANFRKLPAILFAVVSIVPVLCTTRAQAAQSDPAPDPASVLRDILTASCSQDSKRFSTFLTSRNVAAFNAMAGSAQEKLLERFVLVEQAGKPRTETDAAGNLTVFCVTSAVTTELQIGKPDIRENLAYIPLSVKDATDANDRNSRRVIMGLVRESSQWKLLSLGVLLLDLPTLAEEWDREQIQNNEKAAVASLRELSAAIEKYRVTYARLPQTLAELGPPAAGAAVKNDRAGLVGAALAAGSKDGYSFRYVIVGANEVGAPAVYELAAVPAEYGRTGTLSFFRDSSGALHAGDHQGGLSTSSDSKLEP